MEGGLPREEKHWAGLLPALVAWSLVCFEVLRFSELGHWMEIHVLLDRRRTSVES